MIYSVEFTQTAEANAHEIYAYIAEDSPRNAARWHVQLTSAVQSLARFPMRCRVAKESRVLKVRTRELLFGNYRILFTIQKRTVFVLHIRHAARQPMRPEDLKNI